MSTKNKTPQMVYNALHLDIDTNSIVLEEDGVLRFPNGLTLTDDSEQWNGTRYDINTLDLSQYKKRMFADHEYGVRSIVGNMLDIYRVGNKVVTNGVRFAINENPTARLVYDLIVGGFLDSVSIGTQGPYPEDDGVYKNHQLVEVSWVGLPNNKNANVNEAEKLLEIAATNGLDLSKYEDKERKDSMSLVKIKNERDFAVELKFKNEADEEVTESVEAGAEIEVPEAEKESVEKQLADAEAPEEEEEEVQNSFTKEDLELIANVKNELAELRQFKEEHSAEGAKAPKFTSKNGKKGTTPVSGIQENKLADKIKNMDGRERIARIAELAYKNQKWSEEFRALNEANAEELKANVAELKTIDKVLAKNVVTLGPDSFGGLVPSYELLSEIVGSRTAYDSLLSVFSFTNTDNLQYAWNLRVGDINMQPVQISNEGDATDDGRRKPISEYGLNMQTRNLEELAAVTPVANSVTLFAVGDILADIAQGYQNDYKRKLSQLVVAELEKAVETAVAGRTAGGADISANPDASVTATSPDEWKGILQAINEVVQTTPDGVLVMSTASKAVIQEAGIEAGLNNGGFVDSLIDGLPISTLLGHRVVTVPNDLLPTLGTAETRVFVVTGQTVTINHAIFYISPQNWRGITHSSGLSYDLSTDASYEVNLGTTQNPEWVTRSAYQRNELVLRGSFFRGGGVKDFREVTGVLAATVAPES